MKQLQHTGIGPVLNLRFSESFATIMWDLPHTVGVLGNLTYHLTVTIMNTGVVIINTTTTDTTHAIIYPQLCVDYAVCVAAFSPEYRGSSVFIMKRTPGSKQNYYYFVYSGLLYKVYLALSSLLRLLYCYIYFKRCFQLQQCFEIIGNFNQNTTTGRRTVLLIRSMLI